MANIIVVLQVLRQKNVYITITYLNIEFDT